MMLYHIIYFIGLYVFVIIRAIVNYCAIQVIKMACLLFQCVTVVCNCVVTYAIAKGYCKITKGYNILLIVVKNHFLFIYFIFY
jgi:hypothetical protein